MMHPPALCPRRGRDTFGRDGVRVTIKAGKTYENGSGHLVTIAGPAKTAPYLWAFTGDWYDEAGRFVHSASTSHPTLPSGTAYVNETNDWRNLVREVNPEREA